MSGFVSSLIPCLQFFGPVSMGMQLFLSCAHFNSPLFFFHNDLHPLFSESVFRPFCIGIGYGEGKKYHGYWDTHLTFVL